MVEEAIHGSSNKGNLNSEDLGRPTFEIPYDLARPSSFTTSDAMSSHMEDSLDLEHPGLPSPRVDLTHGF